MLQSLEKKKLTVKHTQTEDAYVLQPESLKWLLLFHVLFVSPIEFWMKGVLTCAVVFEKLKERGKSTKDLR